MHCTATPGKACEHLEIFLFACPDSLSALTLLSPYRLCVTGTAAPSPSDFRSGSAIRTRWEERQAAIYFLLQGHLRPGAPLSAKVTVPARRPCWPISPTAPVPHRPWTIRMRASLLPTPLYRISVSKHSSNCPISVSHLFPARPLTEAATIYKKQQGHTLGIPLEGFPGLMIN